MSMGLAPQLIDAHVHVWEQNALYPFASSRKPPAFSAPVEQLLELMQAHGVARTVLVQVIHYLWDNRYLADVLRRYPGRFVGVARVNPEDPAAPAHLRYWVEEAGFRGVRLSPYARPSDDWICGPLMPALWRCCADLHIPMTILTQGPRLPDLLPLIEAHPDLTVVIDHMADIAPDQPTHWAQLLALARYPRVFVKISHPWSLSQKAYPYPDLLAQIRQLCAHFGAQRLLWGSDWPVSLPHLAYGEAVALYRDHLDFLSAADRAAILGGTAQAIWPELSLPLPA